MKARTSSRNAASSLERLSSTATLPLPLLAERAYFQFERPGALRLLIELPVGFRDRRRRHQEIGIVEGIRPKRLDPPLAYPFGVDAGVDDEVRDVDVLRAQFACRCLCNRAQAELGAGERRVSRSTAQGGGRPREEDIALAPRQHQASRFAPGQKAGVAGHFPDLSEHALSRIQNREIDVGPDVENADIERRVLVGIAEECGNFFFLARIERAGVDFPTGLLDLLHERFELGAVAAPGEHRESLRRKLLCDLASDVVTGADHGHGRVFLLQGALPVRFNLSSLEQMPALAGLPAASRVLQGLREFVLEDLAG